VTKADALKARTAPSGAKKTAISQGWKREYDYYVGGRSDVRGVAWVVGTQPSIRI